MESNKKIRSESLKRVMSRKWFFRALAVMMMFGGASNAANGFVAETCRRLGIQTWTDFLVRKAEAMRAGLDYAVPSRAVAAQMNGATAFSLFMAFIFAGIAIFAVSSVMLKAAQERDERWCRDSFGGVQRPLEVAWLGFLVFARICLWGLLLFVPGVVASYRYSQCWNIKVEHPDWSAARCIAESSKMMDGFKWRRFCLDVSICAIVFAWTFPAMMLLSALAGFAHGAAAFAMPVLVMVATASTVVSAMWLAAARAVFYCALKDATEGAGDVTEAVPA